MIKLIALNSMTILLHERNESLNSFSFVVSINKGKFKINKLLNIAKNLSLLRMENTGDA